MTNTPDILIVGAGVIGLACAWRLAQAGLKVRLVDRGLPGQGATTASLGALWPPSPLRKSPAQEAHRSSLNMFPAFAAELCSLTGIDPLYVRSGRIEVFSDASHRSNAAKEVTASREASYAFPTWPMDMLDPSELAAIEPQVRPTEWGAQLCRASAHVSIPELIQALLAACAKAGVTISPYTAVAGLVMQGERVVGVRLADGTSLTASVTVVATGAWTAQIDPILAAAAPVIPVRGQALRLSCPGQFIGRIIKHQKIYLVACADRSILVGSTTEPDAGFDVATTPEGIATLYGGACALVPALSSATVESSWAGLRPDGPKHRPVIAALREGLVVAAGHFKIGIGLAPLTAALVRDICTQTANPTLGLYGPVGPG